MLNSPSDFANWLTMGGVDMVSGAVNPDGAFSKEYWMASFSVFLTGAGARGVSAAKNTRVPKTTNSNVTSPDQKSTVSAAQANSLFRNYRL